jgi:RNA polymerase sigma-70 factor (ECF subfamily)
MKEQQIDKVILIKFSTNEDLAFTMLFDAYGKRIFHFILKYVNSAELAEDLSQEVFLKIWENRKNLGHVQSIKSYLFTVARNHTLNSLKKAFQSEVAISEVVNSFAKDRNFTEEEIEDKEYRQFLKHILDSLPERSRMIFKLCREEKKSYEEVAQAMSISKNAVKNHMVFSMKILKSSLSKELGYYFGFLVILFGNL